MERNLKMLYTVPLPRNSKVRRRWHCQKWRKTSQMRGMKADGGQGGQLWKDCRHEVVVADYGRGRANRSRGERWVAVASCPQLWTVCPCFLSFTLRMRQQWKVIFLCLFPVCSAGFKRIFQPIPAATVLGVTTFSIRVTTAYRDLCQEKWESEVEIQSLLWEKSGTKLTVLRWPVSASLV